MDIRELILKDVRCFAGEQRVRLAPLTFLVGENSTGKTTTLGCLNSILNESNGRNGGYDFNQPPYELGGFAEIARKSKKSFELGYEFKPEIFNMPLTVHATITNGKEDIAVKQLKFAFENGEVIFRHSNNKSKAAHNSLLSFSVKKKDNKFTLDYHNVNPTVLKIEELLNRQYYIEFSSDEEKKAFNDLTMFLLQNISSDIKQIDPTNSMKILRLFKELRYPIGERGTLSFSPTRSKPKRIYDPVGMMLDEDEHGVAKFLMRIKRQGDKQKIFQSLQKFGEASGLFEAIDVKLYGDSMVDPFQIQVKVRDTLSNLLDVGYGVSQILPILVCVFADKSALTMLIQQPEIHIHSRAQVELASLFISAIKKKGQSFVIETHSDAMIDRARIEIRRGNIKPEDVSLVYFEPTSKNGAVKIHNIGYDKLGNLLNVPQGYRDFFMQEGHRLLGFDD